MSTNPNNLKSLDFQFQIQAGNIKATLDIIPEDENKSVRYNERFTITAKYTIGRPNVLIVPFNVDIVARAGEEGSLKRVEILSINPLIPNTAGVAENEEQTVVVTAIVIPTFDTQGSPTGTDTPLHIVANIEMYQPGFGEAATSAVYHTDGDADIPYLRSSDFGDSKIIAWDGTPNLPQHVPPATRPVDVRISVIRNGIVNGFRDYFSRVIENITVTHDLLRDIAVESGFAAPDTYEQVLAKFQIKLESYDDSPTVFNRDDEELTFAFPLRGTIGDMPAPQNLTFATAAYIDGRGLTQQRYRLQWQQPYWIGDPTNPSGTPNFVNYWSLPSNYESTLPDLDEAGRRITIGVYQYRYSKDGGNFTNWIDADTVVHSVQFGNTAHRSVLARINAFPFGNTDTIDAGTYDFQVRARTDELTFGNTLTLREIIS